MQDGNSWLLLIVALATTAWLAVGAYRRGYQRGYVEGYVESRTDIVKWLSGHAPMIAKGPHRWADDIRAQFAGRVGRT